jgi:hypothetical protein
MPTEAIRQARVMKARKLPPSSMLPEVRASTSPRRRRRRGASSRSTTFFERSDGTTIRRWTMGAG